METDFSSMLKNMGFALENGALNFHNLEAVATVTVSTGYIRNSKISRCIYIIHSRSLHLFKSKA